MWFNETFGKRFIRAKMEGKHIFQKISGYTKSKITDEDLKIL